MGGKPLKTNTSEDATAEWCKSEVSGISLNTVTGIVTCNDCGKMLGNFFDDDYKNRSIQGHVKALPVQSKEGKHDQLENQPDEKHPKTQN